MALAQVARDHRHGRAGVRTATGEFPQLSEVASGRRGQDLYFGPRRPGLQRGRVSHRGQEACRSSPLSTQLQRLRRSAARILGERSWPWCQPSTSVNLEIVPKAGFLRHPFTRDRRRPPVRSLDSGRRLGEKSGLPRRWSVEGLASVEGCGGFLSKTPSYTRG
jgi:hypothetical protein